MRVRVIRVWISALVAVALGALTSAPALAAPSGPAYTESPHSGNYYGAASTTSGGGGIFEDRALNTSAGQLVCASAWLRTQFPGTGASGEFVLWLTGKTAHESGVAHYSGLGNLGSWSQLHTCVEATGNHNNLRVQFYPTPGSPTVDMDDIDVHESLAANGGFEVGSGGPWRAYPNSHSNFSDYRGATAHSGSRWGATNTASGGGGIYQDVPLNTTPGQLICGSAWLRNEGSGTTASGQFVLWLTGETRHEAGAVGYGGLGRGSHWTEVQTCVEATGDHNNLRIQFYPRPGSNTVEIDDVDVHESLAANGGFEYGSAPWGTYPGTNSSFATYRTSVVYGPPPPVDPVPIPTPIPRPRARHALKVKLVLKWTWNYGLTWLDGAKIGRFPRDTRLTLRCLGRGCSHRKRATAVGRRRIRRLLRAWRGRRFRAGDHLIVVLSAPGYLPQRAAAIIRYADLPRIKLL
jgi:hypothetical protein